MTILEAINKSTEYFSSKGIESPRINAELLLADILKIKRLDLYLKFDKPLDENEISIYREYIKRRAAFEPLQYITGEVEFFGLKFNVNKNVLIPRPETEMLVEKILELTDKNLPVEILDIGTGSGNISIALAIYLINAKIDAIDKSSSAIEIAKNNSESLGIQNNINFYEKDIFNLNSFPKKYDVIVSNPPYVNKNEYDTIQNEIKYEPKIAVTDFEDGFKFYNQIIKSAKNLLKDNGKLFLELGHHHSEKVKTLFEENNFCNVQIWNDYQNIPRVIKGDIV